MSEISVNELQRLDPSAVIELFEIDATALGGDILYLHSGTNELSQNIIWNGQTYVRYPVQISGFEITGEGAFPRPKLAVSNALSAISTVVQLYDDLIGVKVTRKRTLKKFLDAVNFESGVNADADPTAEFPADIYFIDRKSREDNDFVEFELASAIDLAGIKLPRRQVIQNVCIWKYRGAECGYTGGPHYDINDEPVVAGASSEAQAVIDAKVIVDQKTIELQEAEEALSLANAEKGNACSFAKLESRYEITIPEGTSTVVTDNNYSVAVLTRVSNPSAYAKWNGSVVTLGNQYRIGKLRETAFRRLLLITSPYDYEFYEIERWGVDSGTCSPATAAVAAAEAARDAAQDALDAALDVYNAAFAALPSGDSVFNVDRCGKRLSSCKLRFGENNPLPFGSFPSASLVK